MALPGTVTKADACMGMEVEEEEDAEEENEEIRFRGGGGGVIEFRWLFFSLFRCCTRSYGWGRCS